MGNITERYGTVLRIYDNGGLQSERGTFDRYTIIPPRWAHEYREKAPWEFTAIGSSADPFYPQGFGMVVRAVPGKHLGKRLHWDMLPAEVQQFARLIFPEYAPRKGD